MVAKLKHKSASVTLRPLADGKSVWVANLYADERNQGHAKELMQIVIDKADRDGIILELDARAYGPQPYGLSNGELILFYESFGFESVPGLGKNLMQRYPSQ